MRRNLGSLILLALMVIPAIANSAAPTNFRQAKIELKNSVYADQTINGALGTTYCGCNWRWVGESGGRIDLESCGYKIRSPQSKHAVTRAKRIEWEHIFAVSDMARTRQCWKNGGRTNCRSKDPIFNAIEADAHNLTPISGELNGDASNYPMGIARAPSNMYGQCASKVDFKNRILEPRDEAKGLVARASLYISDYYAIPLSAQQQHLFMDWNSRFPVTQWELERDRRIAKIMGHNNPFVTGQKAWVMGMKPSGEGINKLNAKHPKHAQGQRTPRESQPLRNSSGLSASLSNKSAESSTGIKGNANSKIYHLKACPNFKDVSERNSIYFSSEREATSKGFRKARNCP